MSSSPPNGDIYVAVSLRASTTALINAIEEAITQYDFSLHDTNCSYHVIDAEILQKCLLYSSTDTKTEFKLDQQYTPLLSNAINLIAAGIGSLELDSSDLVHNSNKRDSPTAPNVTLSYPGVPNPNSNIIPDRSTIALHFVSYLASLLFYNSKAHAPFSNIFNINMDFIKGLPLDSTHNTTIGAQLIEQLDPNCNEGQILRTMFDQLLGIDSNRFNVADDLNNGNGFVPLPFRNGDRLTFDITIDSVVSTPSVTSINPTDNSYLNAKFRSLTVGNLFKNNTNIILPTPSSGLPNPNFNTAFVKSASTSESLIMQPKTWRVKLLLENRQSLLNLPSVASTYFLYNAPQLSEPVVSKFSDFNFTGTGLDRMDMRGNFRHMVDMVSCPDVILGSQSSVQIGHELFTGVTLNASNITILSQLLQLVKLSNSLLINILSNMANISDVDVNNSVDDNLTQYTKLVDNMNYTKEMLLLLVSLSNSSNASAVFKQKEVMMSKLASNIINNITDTLLSFFSSFGITYNSADLSMFSQTPSNNATDSLTQSSPLVLALDCLKQLFNYTSLIQSGVVVSQITSATSVGFCEPVELSSCVNTFVANMAELPLNSYSAHFNQYCRVMQDALLLSNYILEGGSFNPMNFIDSIIDDTNSAYSKSLLNYGLVITNMSTKHASLGSFVVDDQFNNLSFPSLFVQTNTVPSVSEISTLISSSFSSSVSLLNPVNYTDLTVFINAGQILPPL